MKTLIDTTLTAHTTPEIEAALEKLFGEFLLGTDVEDVMTLVFKLQRLAYADGYNKAARQFGTGNIEFFKGDV